MILKIMLLLLFLIFLSAQDTPDKLTDELTVLPFTDEAALDSAFYEFRERLIQAVIERDTSYVLSVFHPEVKLDFGGGYGIEELRRRLSDPDWYTDLWTALHSVLSLGGTFSGSTHFIAPYVYSMWPNEYDAFNYLAITEDDVPVYKKPDTTACIVTHLSYTIVEYDYSWYNNVWVKIYVPPDKTGYVKRTVTRGPIDYRVFFVKTDSEWKITIFLAGD